jgi:hypothetical protein
MQILQSSRLRPVPPTPAATTTAPLLAATPYLATYLLMHASAATNATTNNAPVPCAMHRRPPAPPSQPAALLCLLPQASAAKSERDKASGGAKRSTAISSTALTPGTPFLYDTCLALAYYACNRLQAAKYRHLRFELSGATVQVRLLCSYRLSCKAACCHAASAYYTACNINSCPLH